MGNVSNSGPINKQIKITSIVDIIEYALKKIILML